MERGGDREIVRVYIWNLSHGGGQRSEHEFRIQITGIDGFQLEPDGTTLILGWSDDFGAFAAFDARRRTGPLGASPSIQLLASTLNAATADGAALQKKGGEFAVAVRPDRLSTYVQNYDAVHQGDISRLTIAAVGLHRQRDEELSSPAQPQFGSLEVTRAASRNSRPNRGLGGGGRTSQVTG
jgi:putative restriction endonuclease